MDNITKIPADIVAVMRELLQKALQEARTKEPPGDGSMIGLHAEAEIHGGKWEPEGWSLQANVIQDVRMHGSPFVRVDAYHGSTLTSGWVAAAVEYTPEDKQTLARARLVRLKEMRDELDAEIERTRREAGE